MSTTSIKPNVEVRPGIATQPSVAAVPRRLHYFFEETTQCDMCGDLSAGHKVLGQRLNTSQGMNPKKAEGISVTIKQCTNCNLIYSSPMPVPFDIQDHYSKPPDSYWKEEDRLTWTPGYFSREIETVKSLLNFHEGMLALEIGAGTGMCMISMNKAGFDAYGLEPSEAFYRKAIDDMGIDPKDLKLGLVEDVEYPDNTFDFISFGAVAEHLYHPGACIEKAMRWLKPGGIIYVEVPNSKYFVARLINMYFKLRGTNYVTHLSPMHSPYHLYEFDRTSFEKLGERLGFGIEKYEYLTGKIFSIPGILHPMLLKYMKKTGTGIQLIVYLRKF